MLVPTKLSEQATVKHLFELWTERYSVKLQGLDLENTSTFQAIREACLIKGRIKIGTKFPETIVKFKSQLAGLQARVLYQYAPDEVDLEEVRVLAESVHRIYLKLLEVYQKPTEQKFSLLPKEEAKISLSSLGLPDLETVSIELEPMLLECQDQHMQSRDWKTLGFLTTQFNITNSLLLDDPQLSIIEKRLLKPYLTFLEEQVALPWQRVCLAAAKYELDDPIFKIVAKMFPLSQKIAQKVNTQLIHSLSSTVTRRGKLSVSVVSHSCLRDFCMFQAYIWLCLLDKSMASVEQELITLCIMVLPSMKVGWPIIEQSLIFLSIEILSHLNPEEINLVEPYLIQLKKSFALFRIFFEIDNSPLLTAKA